MLGYYSAWAGPDNTTCEKDGIQKRNVISLGYSRDGFHFSRPTHEPFMNVNETEGAWNWGNMQSICGVPIIVGDSLYFYSSGRRLNNIMWDSYTSTGLATLRRDGFASMRTGEKEGFLVTEKLTFDGKYLFVNADVKKGSLAIEVLDEPNCWIYSKGLYCDKKEKFYTDAYFLEREGYAFSSLRKKYSPEVLFDKWGFIFILDITLEIRRESWVYFWGGTRIRCNGN